MEPTINPMVEFYRETYAAEFKKLSKTMQDRVLAYKVDDTLLDPEVEEWIGKLCELAEAKEAAPIATKI